MARKMEAHGKKVVVSRESVTVVINGMCVVIEPMTYSDGEKSVRIQTNSENAPTYSTEIVAYLREKGSVHITKAHDYIVNSTGVTVDNQ